MRLWRKRQQHGDFLVIPHGPHMPLGEALRRAGPVTSWMWAKGPTRWQRLRYRLRCWYWRKRGWQ